MICRPLFSLCSPSRLQKTMFDSKEKEISSLCFDGESTRSPPWKLGKLSLSKKKIHSGFVTHAYADLRWKENVVVTVPVLSYVSRRSSSWQAGDTKIRPPPKMLRGKVKNSCKMLGTWCCCPSSLISLFSQVPTD